MAESANHSSSRLQEAVLAELITQVEDGVVALDKDGEEVRLSPPPQVLGKAIEYLKQFPPRDLPTPEGQSETIEKYDKHPY